MPTNQPINIEQEFKKWLSAQPSHFKKSTTLNLYNKFTEYLFIERFAVFNSIVNEYRKSK